MIRGESFSRLITPNIIRFTGVEWWFSIYFFPKFFDHSKPTPAKGPEVEPKLLWLPLLPHPFGSRQWGWLQVLRNNLGLYMIPHGFQQSWGMIFGVPLCWETFNKNGCSWQFSKKDTVSVQDQEWKIEIWCRSRPWQLEKCSNLKLGLGSMDRNEGMHNVTR